MIEYKYKTGDQVSFVNENGIFLVGIVDGVVPDLLIENEAAYIVFLIGIEEYTIRPENELKPFALQITNN